MRSNCSTISEASTRLDNAGSPAALDDVYTASETPEAFTAIIFAMKDQGAAETINTIDVVSAQQTERQTMNSQGLSTRKYISSERQEDDEVLAAPRHLASVHDALQKDDSVRMAAKDSVYQASQNAQFNDWVKLRSSSGKQTSHGVSQ